MRPATIGSSRSVTGRGKQRRVRVRPAAVEQAVRADALTAALHLTALAAAAVQALAEATGRSPQDVLQSLSQV